MTNVAISSALFIVVASSAFGQVDAFTLHSKYGTPLDRETFTVRPGVEMVVDYGPSKQVCRIQLPSGIQYGGNIPADAVTKEKIDAVLNEVVPPSIRGKELNRVVMTAGVPTYSVTEYEHVSIGELQVDSTGQGITVTFKDASCPKQQAP
jgi:hypothetical protein